MGANKAVMAAIVAVMMLGGQALAAPSANVLVGTSGPDKLLGGNGPDTVHGLAGDDLVKGGRGPDTVYGGKGNDVVWTGKGGSGTGDAAYGGRGNDRLYNFGSGHTAGTTNGGPGVDRCTVNLRDITAGLVTGCEVVIVR